MTRYFDPRSADWTTSAACKGDDTMLAGPWRPAQLADIRERCMFCPVMAECLSSALEEESGLGPDFRATIRGGLTPKERAALPGQTDRDRRPPYEQTGRFTHDAAGRRVRVEPWETVCIQCGGQIRQQRTAKGATATHCGWCLQRNEIPTRWTKGSAA